MIRFALSSTISFAERHSDEGRFRTKHKSSLSIGEIDSANKSEDKMFQKTSIGDLFFNDDDLFELIRQICLQQTP